MNGGLHCREIPYVHQQRKTSELLHTLDQMYVLDIYRVLHPTTRKYTLFPAAHRTFSKIDNILGYKTSLSKFKKTEITPYIISDHKGIKLDLNNKRNHRKYSNTWRLSNTLLKDQGDCRNKKSKSS
jgi:hypothetical protein